VFWPRPDGREEAALNVNGIDVIWLGHSTFVLRTPQGKTLLVDPWTRSSPVCPEEHKDVTPDLILVTHGHNDHTGDLVEVARRSRAPVVCIYEIAMFLGRQGIETAVGMNKGGTVTLDAFELTVTMTNAHHSSAWFDEQGVGHYLGEPAGFVVGFSNGQRFYIAGDTCLFGDMALIRELWEPQVAILPIGDHFKMDPRQAAYACRLLGVRKVIPCHYATFDVLTGTPAQLGEQLRALGVETEMVTLPRG
jgi:L-ascorbate metabolism protein UlaG (beta-lactamase superfamily)